MTDFFGGLAVMAGLFFLGFIAGEWHAGRSMDLESRIPWSKVSMKKPLIVDCRCNLIPGVKGKQQVVTWTEKYE